MASIGGKVKGRPSTIGPRSEFLVLDPEYRDPEHGAQSTGLTADGEEKEGSVFQPKRRPSEPNKEAWKLAMLCRAAAGKRDN